MRFKLILIDTECDEEVDEFRVPADADNEFARRIGHSIVSSVGAIIGAENEAVLRLTPLQRRLDGMSHGEVMQWIVAYNQYVMDMHERAGDGVWPVCFYEFTMSEEGANYLKNMFGHKF